MPAAALKPRPLLSSLAFVGASLLAGGLHYLFQLRAATRLSLSAFGEFSLWFSYLTIGLIAGTSAQYYANFRPAAHRTMAGAALGAALLLGAVGLLSPWGWALGEAWVIGVLTVLASLAFGFLYGQCQARKLFGVMALGLLLSAAIKVAFTFVRASGHTLLLYFFYATAFSQAAGALLLLGAGTVLPDARAALRGPVPAAVHGRRRIAGDMASGLYLALCTALFPNLDLLVLGANRSDAELGLFNRCLLFPKMVYFGGAIVLQLLLPYQLRQEDAHARPLQRWVARHVDGLFALMCAAGVAGVVLLAPWVARTLLGYSIDAQHGWLVAMALNAGLLLSAQMRIQRALACGWGGATLLVVGSLMALLYALNALGGLSIGEYLRLSLGLHVLALALIALLERARRATRLSPPGMAGAPGGSHDSRT